MGESIASAFFCDICGRRIIRAHRTVEQARKTQPPDGWRKTPELERFGVAMVCPKCWKSKDLEDGR